MTLQEFTSKFLPFAKAAARDQIISPYLLIAQAFLESGKGESVLAKKYNNFFGVKDHPQWQGKTIAMRTKEQNKQGIERTETAKFVVFNTPKDSFEYQIRFLQKNPRYSRAGLFDPSRAGDYKYQADTLQKAGYATDIQYSAKLTTLANQVVNSAKKIAKSVLPVVPVLLAAMVFFL
jgi:flagellum-specific peptidoglycan hydrolase FlgJ